MKISAYLLLLLSISSYSMSAVGQGVPDDRHELLASCQVLATQSEPVNSSACSYYIEGFLAGMRVTGTVNATPLSEENSLWSAFLERVYSTRGASNKANPKQPTHFNHFCLPSDESLTQVINVLSKPLSSPIETTEMLKEKIFQILKAEYPCA